MTSFVVTPSNKQEQILLEDLFQKMNIHFKPLSPDNYVEDETRQWIEFSIENLSRAYSNDEPEYTTEMIKVPNPEYIFH